MSDRVTLEARLEELVEADGDAADIAGVIAQLDLLPVATGDETQEASMSQISAESIGVTPEEITPTSVSGITKEQLGIGGEFTSSLSALSLSDIKACMLSVEDTDDLMVLVSPTSVLDAQHRIHVEQRGEVRRAARGYGIHAAGGVKNGLVTSPNGNLHYVEEGVCYAKTITIQPDSFSGQDAVIERTSECLGHKDYRNIGTSDNPKWETTGREFSRCQHQWALMYAAGYFVSFSKKTYEDVILTEIGQRVGDVAARKAALEQIEVWRSNRQNNFETRKAVAQGIQHAKNVMGIADEGKLPDVPEVLTLSLPSGQSVRDAVIALGGSRFVVEFTLPLNGEDVTQRIRANSLNELASRVAPIFATAKAQGGGLTPVSVSAAA